MSGTLHEDVGMHVCIVDNSSKYFVAQQYIGNTLFRFHDNILNIFVLSTMGCGSTIQRERIFFVGWAKVVTRTRHIVSV